MGRHQYLTRLALGRSAFQSEDAILPAPQSSDDNTDIPEISRAGHAPDQVFDSRGRPRNPETKAKDKAQRRAQNAVLAVFGQVESRDLMNRLNEVKYSDIRRSRQLVLQREHDYGDALDILATVIREGAGWGAQSLSAILQASLYPATVQFTSVVAHQMYLARTGGLSQMLFTAFAGAPACFIHGLIRTLLGGLVQEAIGLLQVVILRRTRHSKTKYWVNCAALVLCELLFLGIDLVFLPLEFHGVCQQLGLAPARPLLPGWRTFIPWHSSSVYQLGGYPDLGPSVLRALYTPSTLMLLRGLVLNAKGGETPFLRMFTGFRTPAIDFRPSTIIWPVTLRDPMGLLLYKIYTARSIFLEWVGWKIDRIHRHPQTHEELENNRVFTDVPPAGASETLDSMIGIQDDATPRSIHRSTTLAHLPAQYLADTIDDFLARIVTLPLSCIAFQSIAAAYLSSPLPKTAFALSIRSQAPFRLNIPHSRREIRGYASKVGIGITLQTTVELAFFFGVYGMTRWCGMHWFDWGRKGKIGQLTYSPPRTDVPQEGVFTDLDP